MTPAQTAVMPAAAAVVRAFALRRQRVSSRSVNNRNAAAQMP